MVRALGPHITFPTKENATTTGWAITVAGDEADETTYQFEIKNASRAEDWDISSVDGGCKRWTNKYEKCDWVCDCGANVSLLNGLRV